jgi:septal ring factor EnvC (AmiA/AmiB activator)
MVFLKAFVIITLLFAYGIIKAQDQQSGKMPDKDTTATAAFEKNKGKYSFPVKNYKTYSHCCNGGANAVKQSLFVCGLPSPDMSITCDKGSEAYSIADGKVTKITKIDSYQTVVIIRHGSYLTVYAGLDTTYVKVGETVYPKTKIGLVATRNSETVLEFQLWNGTKALDPVDWLYDKRK